MCGLVGFWQPSASQPFLQLQAMASVMASRLIPRGPDAEGTWCDEKEGLALGHRRLKIQDLSAAGAQPMVSSSGRFVVIYNGEIYNAPQLKVELESLGIQFRGHSDTEVLLEAWEKWGGLRACQKFNGIFAFALWDRREKTLSLVRDRIGVKPLYWGIQENILFFGSTLHAFQGHPQWDPLLNREAVDLFMRYGYIPAPHSIYQGFYKLSPGTLMTFRQGRQENLVSYWELPSERRKDSPEALLQELTLLLHDAVKSQLLSDVPVGAFLSGGIDSSLVTALMQQLSPQPVKTFSIGFHEEAFNEADHAASVAKHLGTDHHEMYLTSEDVAPLIPQISTWYDEPFADSSQLPTYLVSRLARRHVTVSLSGDGGDELFAGYTRYILAQRLWKSLSRIPLSLRRLLAKSIGLIPLSVWEGLRIPGHKALKLQAMLESSSPYACYEDLVTHWRAPLVSHTPPLPLHSPAYETPDVVRLFQKLDLHRYLPDDILVKVDRASMAVGLEARVPLLDHHLIEFAWSLPTSFKMHQGKAKWPLRQILYDYVPPALIDRPKMGFGIPLGPWLRGPLKQWAEDLLSDHVFDKTHLLERSPIQKRLKAHMEGLQDWSASLWNVLIFHDWLSHNKVRL